MSRGEIRTFQGYIWYQVIDGEVTVGVNEERLDELETLHNVKLPEVGETVDPDEVCAELETEGGGVDVYSPVSGSVTEINASVADDPQIILDDPFDDGWLFKVEPTNMDELVRLENEDSGDWDEDDDEDDDDDDEDSDGGEDGEEKDDY